MVQSLQQSSPEKKKEQKANLFSFLRKCQNQERILNIQQRSLKLSARLLSHCWSRSQSFRLAQPLPITAVPPRAREPAPTHCRSRSRPGTSFSKIAATETLQNKEQLIIHSGRQGTFSFTGDSLFLVCACSRKGAELGRTVLAYQSISCIVQGVWPAVIAVRCCLSQGFCCNDKIPLPKATWGPKGFFFFFFSLNLEFSSTVPIKGSPEAKQSSRQELQQRPWRNATCWLAPPAFFFFFFFCSTQDHHPRDDTLIMSWALPVINQENAPQPSQVGTFSPFRLPLQK